MADQTLALVEVDCEENVAHVPVSDNGKVHCASIKDKDNPYSVYSLSPRVMREALLAVPDEFFLLDEQQLSKMACADARLRTMRVTLQREYERVITYFQRTGQLHAMRMTNIFGGIITEPTFYKMIRKPENLAYMTMPIVDYHDSLKSLSLTILQRYDEILNVRLVDDKGNLKVGTARVVLEAMRGIEDRVWGKALQRISAETKSVQITVPVPERSMGRTTDMMLSLEQRVKELSAELYGVRKLGEPGQLNVSSWESARSPESYITEKENRSPGWTERRLKAKEGEVVDGTPDTEESDREATSSDGLGGEGSTPE